MIEDILSKSHQVSLYDDSNKIGQDIQLSQEIIYSFFLYLVKQRHPETALLEFKHLFIDYANTVDSEPLIALGKIVSANDEGAFRDTLKRSCYILINNWESARHYGYTQELIKLFPASKIDKKTLSPVLDNLQLWLANFADSQDYQQLQLFALPYESDANKHWSHRYASYLLVPLYVDLSNPPEQREAAINRSQRLKNKFKFDLAIYTARSQSTISKDKMPKNPTNLGHDVLRLIKMIVAKRGDLNYTNLATIFLKQTEKLNYQKFKLSLQRYLFFSVGNQDFAEGLNNKLAKKLETLYKRDDENTVNDDLMLKTCNRAIDYLTIEDNREPSEIFLLFMKQGNPLTLIIVLLKIVLICSGARIHLENNIALLIQYYRNYSEKDCKWMVNFCEIFNITFAIYAENVQYNLIKIKGDTADDKPNSSLDAYRVFAQLKWDTGSESASDDTITYK